MQLTSSQKQQLQHIFSNTNDSFFSFLDNYEYEKKHEKLRNAKEEYAGYGSNEDVLFLLDDTDFGSARDGIVITSTTIYYKNTFENKKFIRLLDINSCKLVREGGESFFDDSGVIEINGVEITMGYFKNTTGMIVNIINKLCEFYKENIIIEKALDLYSTITIPYSLAQSGGKFNDSVSGYDITIPKGVKDGTVWSWNGYGKSYGNVKGKLTVTVKVELPIAKKGLDPKPEPKVQQIKVTQPKQEVKNIYVDCVNCGKTHLNPTSYDCVFCGRSLTVLEKRKLKKVVKEEMSLNDIKVDESKFELIVTCANCDKEIKNYSSDICPHCGEDANIKKKEIKKEADKTSTESEFYLNIDDKATAKDIKEQFNQKTGLIIRIYESSRKQARSNKKLINLAIKKASIRVTTRMKIETIIEKFEDIGVKVRICSFDDNNFCNTNFTLARAKEKYGEK